MSLKSVHLPDSVTAIERSVFLGCEALDSINIPNGVTTIGEWALSCCKSLNSINIPNTVTTIGRCAFYWCSSLQSIDIPNGTAVRERTFYECTSLRSVTIANTVTTIEREAFYRCSSLLSVQIPHGVATIGAGAFVECVSLRSVHIPNTVTENELDAFYHCHRLNQTYIEDTLTWLRRRFDNLPIHHACYYANDDAESAVDHLSKLIQQNKRALAYGDAMGMTPLHILCCNPHATFEMMRVVISGEPSSVTQMDGTGSTPLELFLRCRNLLGFHEKFVKTATTLCDLLERGINYNDLVILFGRQVDSSRNESTGLTPFMSAAASLRCKLDVVYDLAMRNVDMLL